MINIGRFAKFLGDTEIEIDGEKFQLKATVKDMQKIMDSQSSKEKLVDLYNCVFELVKRSYPEEPVEEIESCVSKNLMNFIPELMIAWKWTSREEYEKSIVDAKKSISQM